jgi:hypothetical protein
MSTITAIAAQLEEIYTNPLSYTIIKDESQPEVNQNEIIKKFMSILSKFANIDDTLITILKTTLNVLFVQAGIKVSYDNLKDYLIFMQNKTGACNCTKFVSQTDIINIYQDKDVIPVEIMFKAQSCASCGYFNDNHIVCSKYYVDEPKSFELRECNTCGLNVYRHNICNRFIGFNNRMCDNCGRDLFTHQQRVKNNGIFCCTKFQKTENSIFDCKNCIFTETDHYINPQLYKMNKDAYRKFNDLAFKFQSEFLKQGLLGMSFTQDIFLKVIKMSYSSYHPMYSMYDFQKVEIPTAPNYTTRITSI